MNEKFSQNEYSFTKKIVGLNSRLQNLESKSLDKLVNVHIYLKQQENSFIAVFLFNFKLQWKKNIQLRFVI